MCKSRGFTSVGAISVKSVDVDSKILTSTSKFTWDPMESVKKFIQSIPNVRSHDVKILMPRRLQV